MSKDIRGEGAIGGSPSGTGPSTGAVCHCPPALPGLYEYRECVRLKRIMYGLLFCLLLLGGTAFFAFKPNPMLFDTEGSPLWLLTRCILLSGMLSILIVGGIAVFAERKKLLPYFQKLKKYQPLLYQLVRRDFLAKYKRSVLGILWSILNPLLTMIVMTIVFSTLFRFDVENYPVYLLSGQIVFSMFSEITNTCMGSVLGAASLMKKVSVPKYIFPLSKAISSLVNFTFSFLALLTVMIATGAPVHPQMLYSFIAVVYVFVFSTGIGLILSAAVVFFRDITYLYGILLTAVTYFTPIFYPISIIPDHFRWIISLNPLYHLVECFRTCAIYGGIPTLWQNLICAVLAILSLGAGLTVFYRKQDRFILYV